MTLKSYKDHVKDKIKQSAFEHLTEIQAAYEKFRDIKYMKLETQPYMVSPLLSSEEVKKLATLRSHSIRGTKKTFSSWQRPNLACK